MAYRAEINFNLVQRRFQLFLFYANGAEFYIVHLSPVIRRVNISVVCIFHSKLNKPHDQDNSINYWLANFYFCVIY